ncbi:2238_t:CDS:10 [Entrophospora sp. SA101]|nr:2238_t:CDS:10 [Entrophospora sp. SA101]
MPSVDGSKSASRLNVTIYGSNRANFLSSWLFLWIFHVLKISRKHNLRRDNLFLQNSEKAKILGDKIEENWNAQCNECKNDSKPSILRTLIKTFGISYAFLGIYKLFAASFLFIGSYYLLNELIKYIEQEKDGSGQGTAHVYAVGMFLCALFSSIFVHQLIAESTRIGVQVRAALMVLIYRKALKLSTVRGRIGDIVNLVSNDCNRSTSSRIHLMSEILTAIKLIKFYAWELYFRDRVSRVRRQEWDHILNGIVVKVWTYCVLFGAPILAMLGCLCVRLLINDDDTELDAHTLFTVLALFYTVRYPLFMLPIAVKTTLEAGPINGDPDLRIYIDDADFYYEGTSEPVLKFLSMKVRKGEVIAIVGDVGAGKSSILAAIQGQIKKENGVRKVLGSISYVPHDAWLLNATLKENILFGEDFDSKKYQEVLHCCALNKDLTLLSNKDDTEIGDKGVNLSLGQRQRVSLARAVYSNADIVLLDDPLRFVRQSHYLCNKSTTGILKYLPECDRIMVMRDGECFEEGTYEELEKKDVNLASLVGEYMEIEDPDLIDELIGEIRLEPVLDEEMDNEPEELQSVVVLNAMGRTLTNTDADEQTISRIIEKNAHTIQNSSINEHTISQIIERNNLTVLGGAGRTRMMGNQVNRELNVTAKAVERNQLTIHSINEREDMSLMPDSETKRNEPKISWQCCVDYFNKSTGFTLTFLMILSFFLIAAVRIFSDWWLIKGIKHNLNYGVFLGVYGALVGIIILGVFIRGVFFAWAMMRKSMSLHDRTFSRIMRAPMAYFDITPLGKILNVFAKHQYLVDDVLTDNFLTFVSFLPLIIGTIVFVIILVPWTGLAVVVLIFLLWVLIYYSRDVEERFKQLDADSKASIFSHLSATLEGLPSIRVYNAQTRFDEQNIDKIDSNNKALFAMMQVQAWQSLYIDILASLFIYATAISVILDNKDPSIAGLAIASSLQLPLFGQWMVRSGRDVISIMESVQQLLYYRQEIPSEAPNIIENNRPPSEWGNRGEIEFKNVILRYNVYGVAVLKDISFHIQPREKIGIVGKTGSGKSTLLVSLLRIVELAEGQILIDNLDTKTIGLRDLRNKIAIIPQVIFAGTIRSNLDPFNKCTEEEIWEALRAVHLEDKVKSMLGKLDAQVLENGKIFSLGQRQLFCIARALLKKTNILVLDEATSAVDLHTDVLIQETIKKNFADHTVLTIAHRLNTMVEADRILCLNEGRVIEFDTPLNLLNNQNGFFYQLVACSGSQAAEKLKQMTIQHANSSNSYSTASQPLPDTQKTVRSVAEEKNSDDDDHDNKSSSMLEIQRSCDQHLHILSNLKLWK